jgi:hypothetical protein
MFVPNFRESLFGKVWRKFDKSRPKPSMNIRDFVINQLADQPVGTFRNRTRCSKDYPPFSVSPPTALNWPTRNQLCEARNRTARGLKHDSNTFHQSDCFFWTHFFLISLVSVLKPNIALAVPLDQRAAVQFVPHLLEGTSAVLQGRDGLSIAGIFGES